MSGIPITAPNSFLATSVLGQVVRVGGLYCVVMPITARMEIICRTADESFHDAVINLNKRMPITCAINGLQYALSPAGYANLGLGRVDPKYVSPEGLVVRQSVPIAGRRAPLMFYVAFDYNGGYTFGAGDPPPNSARAIGGVGPIIIDGMPYGVGTVCRRPAHCPPSGPPPSGMEGYLTQRSNLTYKDQQSFPSSTGKSIIATNKRVGKLLVCVQPQGASGSSFDDIKHWLLDLGCDNAVFLDGSDSAMLYARNVFWVSQGTLKNLSNTTGLAFYA